MWAQHMAMFLAWGLGTIDLATFKTAAFSGIAHLLAGVARGPFHDEVVAQIRASRDDVEMLGHALSSA